jgi:hypothetical protein
MNSTKWTELVEAARAFFLAESPAAKRALVIDALKLAGGAIYTRITLITGNTQLLLLELTNEGKDFQFRAESLEGEIDPKFAALFTDYRNTKRDYNDKHDTFRSLLDNLDPKELAEIVLSANEAF